MGGADPRSPDVGRKASAGVAEELPKELWFDRLNLK